MEWKVEHLDGSIHRKYSNSATVSLRRYIDYYGLKKSSEGYNDAIEKLNIYMSEKRNRTEEEIQNDYLERTEI